MNKITSIAILLLLTISSSILAQTSESTISFRGARVDPSFPDSVFIPTLNKSYCDVSPNDLIKHDFWTPSALFITWEVYTTNNGLEMHPDWFTLSGTGKTTVVNFDPTKVDPSYFGEKIFFQFLQRDMDGVILSGYDYTYVYKSPAVFNFGSTDTICPSELANLELSGSEINVKYILLKDGIPYDSLVGDGNLLTFNTSAAGTYTVLAKSIFNDECEIMMNGNPKILIFPPNIPTITGLNSVCVGATGVSYTTEASQANYIWTASAGANITSPNGTNTILVDFTTAGNKTITVNYEDDNGCIAVPSLSYTVNAHALPIPTISGPLNGCKDGVNTYTTQSGMTNYIWTVDPDGTVVSGSGTNTIGVEWTTLGAKNLTVTYTDQFGCEPLTPTVKNLDVYDRPVPTIVGTDTVCKGETNVTYTTEAGYASYTWSVPTGGTITSGGGTNQIKVTWNVAGNHKVRVNYTNAYGCNAVNLTEFDVTVNPTPVPTIIGDNSICIGDLGTVYTTETGMSSYDWIVPLGGAVVSGANEDTLTVNWNTVGNFTVTLSYTNEYGCPALSPSIQNVTVNALPVPTIVASDSICEGAANVTYTTQAGKNAYDWDVPAGGTITSGDGTNQIKVLWTSPGDKIVTVNYENPNGCKALTPAVKNVHVKNTDFPIIAGLDEMCLDTASVKPYTTESGMNNYIWTASPGATITTGAGTRAIGVKWGSAGAKTVTVIYTNSLGCSPPTPTIYNVTVNPLPTPSIVGPGTACLNETGVKYSTELGMTAYNWVIVGGTITSGTGTNEVTVTWTSVGARSISVNYANADGCSAKTPTVKSVDVKASPNPTITTGADSICEGATSIYSTQTLQSNYVWNVPSGGTIVSGTGTAAITVLWNTMGSRTVTVNYENSNGCPAPADATKLVEVFKQPVPTITGFTNTCQNHTVTYTTEAGQSLYNWTVSGGGSIISGNGTRTVQVKWTGLAAQTVSVNYQNPGGCSAAIPTTLNVNVDPSPTPTITGPNILCADSALVTYTTEAGQASYTWTISGGGNIVAGNATNEITVAWYSAGARSVSVNYANTFGCTAPTATAYPVTVKSLPIITITGDNDVCKGEVNKTYTTAAGKSNYDWEVTAGGTITGGGDGFNFVTVTWTTPGTDTVTVNYLDVNACSALVPKKFIVDVRDFPNPTITESNLGCLGATTTYSTEAGMLTYDWTISAGGTIIAGGDGNDSVTVQWNALGAQSVSVGYTNTGGCATVTPTTINLTVEALPVPTILGVASVCQGIPGNQYITEAGMSNYTWTIVGGTINSGQGTNQVSVTWTSTVGTSIQVNYANAHGCSASTPTNFNVTVLPAPVPTITGPNNFCEGTTGLVYTTETGMSAYSWSVSAGGIITSVTNADQITVDWPTGGIQHVYVSYTGANGCPTPSPTNKNINVIKINATVAASDANICIGDAVTFTAAGTGGTGITLYEFFVASQGVAPVQSGASNKFTTSSLVNNDKVWVHVVDASTCEDVSDSINIIVNNPPVAVLSILSPNGNTICAGESVQFSGSAGNANYKFVVDGVVNNNGANPIFSTSAINDGDSVYVIITSIAGCVNTSSSTFFTVYAKPSASLTANPGTSIIDGDNVTFTSTGGGDYEFLVNGSIVQAYSTDNTYASSTLANGDIVSVNVKNANGCIDTETLTMVVSSPITALTVLADPANYCTTSPTGATIFINNPLPGVVYELIRVSNGANLGAGVVNANVVSWSNIKNLALGTEQYRVEAYYPAFPATRVPMANLLSVTESAGPTVYNLIPTGIVYDCNGGAGYELKIDNSDIGFSYVVYKDGIQYSAPKMGVGGELSFGNVSTNGVYTVVATDTAPNGCSITMSGTFEISITTSLTIYEMRSVPANGIFCQGDKGIELILDGTTKNVQYILMRNAVEALDTIKGVGAAISFGYYDVAGSYTVIVMDNGCPISMDGAINISPMPLPTDFSVIASDGGKYCAGSAGVSITLSSQQVGIQYQLVRNAIDVGAPIVGTINGAVLTFPGLYTATGVYSVRAEVPVLGCTSTTAINATVSSVSMPLDLNITGETAFCEGGDSAIININSSEVGVSYEIYKDAVATGIKKDGNGGQLSFAVYDAGSYTFSAYRMAGACFIMLSDIMTVTELPSPEIKNYTWVDGADCQNGTVITIEQTQIGVTYTLFNRASGLPVNGYLISGTGNDESFLPILDNGGVYYIVASSGGCSIELTNFGDITVNIPGVVKKQEVTQPAAICIGDNVTLGLKMTENTINYSLYLVDGDIINGTDLLIETIVGDGAAKNFSSVINSAGEYYVMGVNNSVIPACENEMMNRVNVVFNPLPIAYAMAGSGNYCDGMGAAVVGLEDTEIGVNYILQRSTMGGPVTVGSIVGSGDAIYYPNITTEATYTIFAVNINGCTSSMNNSITVVKQPVPDVFTVSVSNADYCTAADSADLFISGTQNGVTYIVTDTVTNTVKTILSTTDNSSQVKLTSVKAGVYNVIASWGADACQVLLTPNPIDVTLAPHPTDLPIATADNTIVCEGSSTFIRVSNLELGLMYDLVINDVRQNLDIDSYVDPVEWSVTDVVNSINNYKVYAYVSGYPNCGSTSAAPVSVEIKPVPVSPALSPASASYCAGDNGFILTVANSAAGIIYELFDTASVRRASYTPLVSELGQAFSFSNYLTEGQYTLIASYVNSSCASTLNSTAIITEDDSSMTCFPFVAVNDTVYLNKNDKSIVENVCFTVTGGNDIITAGLDTLLRFTPITTWLNAQGDLVSTKGTVAFTSVNNDYLNYTKAENFYGLDSMLYIVENEIYPNRIDTAIVYFFVGNEEIENGKTIIIPNAFTPNGDGKNDKFVIVGLDEDIVSTQLKVFNRWGAMVYESSDEIYKNDWEGFANKGISISADKELPVGTYFYLFYVIYNDGAKLVKKQYDGYIDLRR